MKNELKEGDILYGMWHYTMHYPVYFKVVKVTAKQAQAVELRKRMVRSTDGYGQQGYEAPTNEPLPGRNNHIVRVNKYGDLCTGSKYDYFRLEKWDGQPIWADHMD